MEKQCILNIPDVYTANAFVDGEGMYIGAGSETRGDVRLYNMSDGSVRSLENCPGGMMSLLAVPGYPGMLVSVQGLFPPFIGKDAAIYVHSRTFQGETRVLMELPFAHRCDFIPGSEKPLLLAASVSRHKSEPTDWSLPGELFTFEVLGPDPDSWIQQKLPFQLTRNHGMIRSALNGREALFIGFAQVLALIPGTSRSGITMTAGRFLGFDRDAAVRISFVMSIPVIFGVVVISFLLTRAPSWWGSTTISATAARAPARRRPQRSTSHETSSDRP